ncbi:M16 family metallopeptidase [Blastopirellula marina]|uniref:Insulinase family protein n=1 Tax=Blastopirellula marina TaxID=124 RepID=A0A2S8GQM6_9BACT|nr:pitrilysin family protein [Blastopirellula marina]PQO46740.1 insulinase family protein [Blastopirellula marina]
MQFRHEVLDNGLEIVAEINPNAYSLASAFFVKTGSRDETAEIAGVSHFLEHMVFKGTPRRTAADVNRELDEMGSQANAYTSEEQTVYYAVVLPELQEQVIDLLADIMRPSLRVSDFETEKQVILEEIMKYDDQPPFGGHERIMASFFGKHPLGNSVLGTAETVGALTADQMMDYFQRRYSPHNIVLAASGRVDFDALVEQAKRLCGDWERFETSRDLSRPEGAPGFELICKETAAQEYLIQLASCPASEDDDRYAARLLTTIFGDDTGSRLFWALVDPGLAEFASSDPYEFQSAGVYMNYLCCSPEEAASNLAILNDEVAKLEKNGVTLAELEQAKNKVCSHTVLRSERPSSRLFSVGNGWIQRGKYHTVAEAVASYKKVTLDDVHAVLQKYPLSKCNTLAIGPLAELAQK